MSSNLMSRARVPTPKQLSSVGVRKDEFETFWHILLTYCQQDSGYLDFFPGGKYEKWEALSLNPTRGIDVTPEEEDLQANRTKALQIAKVQASQIRANLNSLLTTIAAYCPDGLFKTIISEATSIGWIKRRLTQVCNIDTSGRHLPKVLDIRFNKGEESPAAFIERVKSSFMDSLMPVNTKYHGNVLTIPETFSPTFESMIIIQCLKAIHPDLPEFIMNNKGMLFTDEKPNFCDIQQEICDTMDTLLAQMEAQNNISRIQVTDSTTPEAIRWTSTSTRGRYNNQRNLLGRPGTYSKSSPSTSKQLGIKKTCDYCQALGKDEKIWSSHDKFSCFGLFPEKRRSRVNARLLSVPVMTDENDTWDLQEALETVENQFYSQLNSSKDNEELTPQ